jgi:ABC-type Fe3+/spermidine/putrescine transport system ATPase subunit
MSNSIAVMNNGVVEQIGNSNEIYENPRTAFVAYFIGETNLFEGRVEAASNGGVTVSAEGIAIRVPGTAQVGQAANVSVRPEKIEIASVIDDLTNHYPVTIDDVIYQGSMTSYQVRLEGGRLLTVDVQNTGSGFQHRGGDRVFVGWQPEKGVLITEGVS